MSFKDKHHSEETKIKISKVLKGKRHSNESIKKQSKTLKRRWSGIPKKERLIILDNWIKAGQKAAHLRDYPCGVNNPFYGKHHSNETKEKISKANKGHIAWNRGMMASKELKRRLSEAHKGIIVSEETRKKMSKVRKGHKFSKEHNKKISEARKRWWKSISKEQRRKITENGIAAAQQVNPSSIEKAIWKVLDILKIDYKIQYKISKWIVDIYIPNRNLIIECNGTYWHNYKIFPEKKIRDNSLQNYAKINNYKLVWLWENEIRKDAKLALKNGLKIVKWGEML